MPKGLYLYLKHKHLAKGWLFFKDINRELREKQLDYQYFKERDKEMERQTIEMIVKNASLI